mmetsp:Transcript_23988/g.36299  ORF Transcript_23988/g.36299 Transcript_23988/m.36299 type:complete len:115 (-) Transcript_23988:786-1130(-)
MYFSLQSRVAPLHSFQDSIENMLDLLYNLIFSDSPTEVITAARSLSDAAPLPQLHRSIYSSFLSQLIVVICILRRLVISHFNSRIFRIFTFSFFQRSRLHTSWNAKQTSKDDAM